MLLLDLVPSLYVNHTLFDLVFTFTANGAEKAHLLDSLDSGKISTC
jgi:hypothetical protein